MTPPTVETRAGSEAEPGSAQAPSIAPAPSMSSAIMRTSESAHASLVAQLHYETDVMLRHALTQGLQLASDTVACHEALRDIDGHDPDKIRRLTRIHAQLAHTVAPATPRSLRFLQKEAEAGGFWSFLGPIRLVRRLIGVAICSVVALFALSLSPQVDGRPGNFSLFNNSGLDLLLNELFLLSAASLGVSFANLYQAQIYLRDCTFDPRFESSYWVRYVLGLMSGTILAFLVPIDHWLEGGKQAQNLHGMGKPTLALLGGFSTQAIYRILFQMVNAIESLVRGNTRATAEAQEAQARVEFERRELQTRAELSQRIRGLTSGLDSKDPVARAMVELADEMAGAIPPSDLPAGLEESPREETSFPDSDTQSTTTDETSSK